MLILAMSTGERRSPIAPDERNKRLEMISFYVRLSEATNVSYTYTIRSTRLSAPPQDLAEKAHTTHVDVI